MPAETIHQQTFNVFIQHKQQLAQIESIMLAHRVIKSGIPNWLGCRIPVKSHWNLPMFEQLLQNYNDREVLEWLKYGFPISRADTAPIQCLPTVITEAPLNILKQSRITSKQSSASGRL